MQPAIDYGKKKLMFVHHGELLEWGALFTLIAVVHIYGENFAGLSMCNYHKKYNYAFNATWLN